MSKQSKETNGNVNLAIVLLVSTVLIVVVWSKYKLTLISAFYRYLICIRLIVALLFATAVMWCRSRWIKYRAPAVMKNSVFGKDSEEKSMLAGFTQPEGSPVYLKQEVRLLHAQVVGGTGSGKTESTICPMALDDIKSNRGFVLIDGKSDRSLLDKLYAYAVHYGRAKDFKILSLADASISHSFNPFEGGSAVEVTERIFNALNFEDEYYRSIQYDALVHCLSIMEMAQITASPRRVIELLRNAPLLSELAAKSADGDLLSWGLAFAKLAPNERELRASGLISQLQAFVLGEAGPIFNPLESDIVFEQVMNSNQIVYCQLPAMKIPSLGKATGKLVLQSLQSAISSRHLGKSENKRFFSVYLDDFTEYLTPTFATLLNKSRSANVGIVFAHQALGDLDILGEGLKNSVLTNSNLKIFMKTNEPSSAEYFASVVGTQLASKVTERQVAGTFGSAKTGDGSVREAEEFMFHPHLFKQEMGVGEAVVVLPHSKGALPLRMKFNRVNDIESVLIPAVEKHLGPSVADSGMFNTPVKAAQPSNRYADASAICLIRIASTSASVTEGETIDDGNAVGAA